MPDTTVAHASPIVSREQLRQALRRGGIVGAVLVFIALIGALNAFTTEPIVRGILSLTQAVLAFGGLGAGYFAQRTVVPEQRRRATLAATGAVAGAAGMVLLSLLTLLVNAVNMREVLVNATPDLVAVLTFGLPLAAGVVVLPVAGAVLGAAGGLWTLVPRLWQRTLLYAIAAVLIVGVLREYGLSALEAVLLALVVGGAVRGGVWVRPLATERYRRAQRQRGDLVRWLTYGVVALLLLLLPQVLGIYGTSVLDLVGLYVLMGLGLNIVVGYAGLLNLGYVAFFAIGAYTTGLLTSPVSSAHLALNFWLVLPIAAVVTAVAAAALAIPVLRMRGDYLAIVTLGFGEIIRILILSDTFKGVLGGAQGIIEIPSPALISAFTQPSEFYYLIVVACAIAAIVSLRVSESPTGRAWVAMREDEDVAEATGVNLVRHKLLAFALGASFAGVGGAIFASWVHSAFPNSFTLLVSINILSLVIVGGLGSIPGVIIGALVLVGLPEVLRAFADYRMLTFGALLVLMMLARPEGLWPAQHRRRELASDDAAKETATWPSA
jgi:branched-chain amino acid transport system permease protein